MFSRVDFDSLCCLVGGALIGVGSYLDTFLPTRLSVEALVHAESQSILEVQFQISETLHATPADMMQVIGGIGVVVGFCNLVCKKIRTWYNARK